MTVNDGFDSSIQNWSRRYEWNYVLKELRNSPLIRTVLNAACGESEIHGIFAHKLDKILPDKKIYNCDVKQSEVNSKFSNFFVQDITVNDGAEYDAIVCISTLEDFGSKAAIHGTLLNFLEQAAQRVIVTVDYPSCELAWIEEFAGQKIPIPVDKLTGSNSTHPQHEHANLSIILLDIDV